MVQQAAATGAVVLQADLSVAANSIHKPMETKAKLPKIKNVDEYPICCAIHPPIAGLKEASDSDLLFWPSPERHYHRFLLLELAERR